MHYGTSDNRERSIASLNERTLFKAIEKRDVETTKRLLKEKVSPDAAEPAGYFRDSEVKGSEGVPQIRMFLC